MTDPAGASVLVTEHAEWRVLWRDEVVDGPFINEREARDFERQFGSSGRVQKRTLTTTATEWQDRE